MINQRKMAIYATKLLNKLQFNKKKSKTPVENMQRIWAIRLEKEMDLEHKKSFSVSLIIAEMQIKTAAR